MPVTYDWVDSDHQIYLVHVEAPWTWAEFQHEAIFSQIRAESHPVIVIFDVIQGKGFPKGDILRNFRAIEKSGALTTNISEVTIVGAPYLAKTFTNVYQQLRHDTKQPPINFANTLDEALKLAIKAT